MNKLKIFKITLEIKAIDASKIKCLLYDKHESVNLSYCADKGNIVYDEENHFTEIIRKIQFQFEKVMRSAIKGKLSVNQRVSCVFIENFNFLNDIDYRNYIRVDRRNEKLDITTSKTGMKNIHKIYADGSHTCKTRQSAYAGFIETPDGKQQIYKQTFNEGSSNMMELLGVMEGLQHLKGVNKIQVNTDSRFVIRGLVQWVHFWKHNNWQTAYGQEVKFAKYWQQINALCDGKIIEFRWIKGHSGDQNQDFCHQLAKESAQSVKHNTSNN